MKTFKVKDFKIEKLKIPPLLYIKNYKALKKAQKIRKKINTIDFKQQNSKKNQLLLSMLE